MFWKHSEGVKWEMAGVLSLKQTHSCLVQASCTSYVWASRSSSGARGGAGRS